MSVRTEREIELKLSGRGPLCAPTDVVRIAKAIGIELRPRRTIAQTDRYFDDAALHLTRAGISLRARTVGRETELTVKVELARDGDAFRRDEVGVRNGRARPQRVADLPEPLRDRVEPFAPAAKLRPLAVLRTRRERLSGSGLEVALDFVSARTADRRECTFTELEIELDGKGDRARADALADALAAELGLTSTTENKLQRALAGCGVELPPVLGRVHGDQPVPIAAIAALAEHLRRAQAAEVRVRAESSPESVHKLRVACRRARAVLRTFAPWIPEPIAKLARRSLRATAAAFGDVRDRDAWLETAAARIDRVPGFLEKGTRRLIARFLASADSMRGAARPKLRAAERLDGLARVLEFLDTAVEDPKRAPLVRDVAPRLVRRAANDVFEHGGRLGSNPTVPELHRLRILLKRLRYTAECFGDAYGKDLRRFIERTAHLQEVLGQLNDAAVATELLHRTMRDERGLSRTELAALGALATLEVDRCRDSQHAFQAVWAEFDSDDVRTWLDAALRA